MIWDPLTKLSSLYFMLGLLSLLCFSWDQLDRPIEGTESDQRRNRILKALAPSLINSRLKFLRGYALYLIILVFIYVSACIYGKPLIYILFKVDKSQLNLPELPLLIGLAMVGMNPLARALNLEIAEKRFRKIAYAAASIPTNFNKSADALGQTPFNLDDVDPALLDEQTKGQYENYIREIGSFGFSPEFLSQHQSYLTKLIAFDKWDNSPLIWPGTDVKSQFEPLLRDIRIDVSAMLAEFRQNADGPSRSKLQSLLEGPARELDANFASQLRAISEEDAIRRREEFRTDVESWHVSAARTSDDVCSLFALFIGQADSPPDNIDSPISKTLLNLYEQSQLDIARRTQLFDVISMTVLAASITAFSVGLLGEYTNLMKFSLEQNILESAVQHSFNALFLIGSAVLASLAARSRNWVNPFDQTGLFPWWGYTKIFVSGYIGWAISYLMLISAIWFYSATMNHGNGVSICSDTSLFNCYIQQLLEQQEQLKLTLLFALAGGAVSAIIHLIYDSAEYELSRKQTLLIVGICLVTSAFVFLIYYIGNIAWTRSITPTANSTVPIYTPLRTLHLSVEDYLSVSSIFQAGANAFLASTVLIVFVVGIRILQRNNNTIST